MKGSVFKRCTNCGRRVQKHRCKHCGSGFTWGFVFDIVNGGSDKRQQVRRTGFRTKGEAQERLAEMLADVQNDTFVEPSPTSVATYLEDQWLPATRPPRVKWQTWKDRQQQLRAYVTPQIGDVPLQDLTPLHLNRLYADLLHNGRIRGEGGLSPSSVHAVHRILRKALNDAVRWRQIKRNPALLADPPPQKVVRAAHRSRMKTWTVEEAQRFLRDATADDHFTLWRLALATGLRRSELLGLHWHDLDLQSRVLAVRQTVVVTENGYGVVDDQKTDRSGRTIHLDAATAEVLADHRTAQQAGFEKVDMPWDQGVLVFCDCNGEPYRPGRISKAFRGSSPSSTSHGSGSTTSATPTPRCCFARESTPRSCPNGSATAPWPSPSTPTRT